jgi:hypothetical protein
MAPYVDSLNPLSRGAVALQPAAYSAVGPREHKSIVVLDDDAAVPYMDEYLT